MRYFIILMMLFPLISVSAQGYSNGTDFSGRGRSLVPQTPGTPPSYSERPDANLISIERAGMYEELLSLDSFTTEVLKSYLKDHYTKLIEIQFDDQTSSLEVRRENVEKQKKDFKSLLDDFLPEDQVAQIITEEETGNAEKKVDKLKKENRKKKRKKKKGK